ncbi:phage tail sheath family protein [Paenibacillus antarcticus]|uniref:Phage tail sheath protein n=1 Tax=Paenibacillus antarcticus TaxID=253703 RepID=A0A168P9T8_9BACL|nr:phage tail sheath family protein [Paenibacillus antarcticus]OAB46544.1 phage tail sheath protein [Paenibacillus antarcticus]
MAGGTFVTQNKVRPGVYIETSSVPKPLGTLGERGITALALTLPWGPSKQVITVEAGADTFDVLGYDITDASLLLVKESLKRAKTLLLYRLNEGVKATASLTTLTVTAKYGGVRGNDISVIIQTNIDDPAKFDVNTLVSGTVVNTQIVSSAAGFVSNNWIAFSGTGALTVTAGLPLTGGTDGVVTNADHTAFLAAVELLDFNTVGLTTDEAQLKSVYTAFVKRLREEEGKKVQAVVPNYPIADYEGVISVKNGVVLSDGTTLTNAQAVAWVAGATAAANVNEALTYSAYDNAVDVTPRYTNTQIIAALNAGEFLFTASNGRAIVEQDINTLHRFTVKKGRQFRKNRVIRVLDGIANDLKSIFEKFYIGKVDNNADGRNLLKSEAINVFTSYEKINALQNFDAQKDISFIQGTESDAVYAESYPQPVDSIEKIYMRVQVK